MNIEQHLDYAALSALKEVMEDDFNFLIETFLQDSQDKLTNLHTLSDSTDSDAIRRAAHSFKGSCSNIGALRLAGLCATVEHNALQLNFDQLATDVKMIAEEFAVIEKLLREYVA